MNRKAYTEEIIRLSRLAYDAVSETDVLENPSALEEALTDVVFSSELIRTTSGCLDVLVNSDEVEALFELGMDLSRCTTSRGAIKEIASVAAIRDCANAYEGWIHIWESEK